MDLWVVAAAAGAGYIAKNLQNLTVDKKEDLLEPALKYPGNAQSESMNILQQIRYNTCPLRRLERNRAQHERELASSTAGISGQRIPEFEDGECKNSRRLKKGKFIRSGRSAMNIARPLISIENELDYELSKDGDNERNVFTMFPSVSTVRPLLVTDGTGLTSRSSSTSSLALLSGGEIVNEGYYQPPGKNDTPSSVREPIASPNTEAKESTKFDTHKASDDNAENLDSRSRIEEELQAELEMLEYNMNASALENIYNIVELDPDYEPDIARGDLKPMMAMEAQDTTSESGYESTSTTTNISQPPNYAVSPHELSFRLHELIESRLEARIKELEIALSNSERKVQVLGSQGILSGRRLSFSETEYSCSLQSPINNCGHYTTDGSLVRNISSNSLDSIKEANGTLMRAMKNKQERIERSSTSSCGSDHEMHSTVQKLIDGLFNDEKNVSQQDFGMEKGAGQDDSVQDVVRTWDRQMSRSLILDEDFESEDEEETDDSEMLLIKKIVERRRSDSAFVFNFDEFRTPA
ncbi:hypothetical protein F511_24758 [Dorcoceras hygrometricum]|uniref:Uncharacterized protein n=1 Tax=Dorcoceras hygrometricum TaxID=472368 RepID=A0A2Z7AKW2_9LAMI|nr:hypothetical protein F511_24758 [Dorcoceras hygrometricum]